MKEYTLNDLNPYIMHCGYMNEENCPPPGTHFGVRRVKWFEMELILWGKGSILVDGELLNTEKGSLFLRTPGMVVDGISPYKCYLVCFDGVLDQIRMDEYKNENKYDLTIEEENLQKFEYVKSIKGLQLPKVMKVMKLEEYQAIFEKMYSLFLSDAKENQFFLKSFLLQLLVLAMGEWAFISKKESTNRSTRNNFPKITKVKEYIDSNPKKNLTLEQISALAGLSPSFFCRKFKSIIGISPVTYINNKKIHLAKQLLLKTNMSVKEIALECGFDNDTYFFTLFKREQGISPLCYREKFSLPNIFVKE